MFNKIIIIVLLPKVNLIILDNLTLYSVDLDPGVSM